jgi:hypothetical protein
MSAGVGHVPGCSCRECKPPLGEAMPASGETFRVFFELSFDHEARDYFTANQEAHAIAAAIATEVSKVVLTNVRVLGVERKA